MSRAGRIVLFACLGVLTVVLILVGMRLMAIGTAVRGASSAAAEFDREGQPWTECSITLPGDEGEVVFLRRRAHPFLAEYDRRLRIEAAEGADTVLWLPTNVGGRTMVNLYWYPATDEEGPLLRLEDHWGVYVLDVQRRAVGLMRELDGVPYIADVPPEAKGEVSSGWSKADGEEHWTYRVCGNEGGKVTGRLAHSKGQYIGRLDGRQDPLRFVSAEEAPQEGLDTMR